MHALFIWNRSDRSVRLSQNQWLIAWSPPFIFWISVLQFRSAFCSVKIMFLKCNVWCINESKQNSVVIISCLACSKKLRQGIWQANLNLTMKNKILTIHFQWHIQQPYSSHELNTIHKSKCILWPKLYIPSTPNNSNETHTFMCLGRTGRFGQR